MKKLLTTKVLMSITEIYELTLLEINAIICLRKLKVNIFYYKSDDWE